MVSSTPSTSLSAVPTLKASSRDAHAEHAHDLFASAAGTPLTEDSQAVGHLGVESGDVHDVRDQTPPDRACLRGDVVSEWREGKDKVVEIQRAPGEDVEVLVIKNAFCTAKPGGQRTRSPRGAAFVGRCVAAVHHAEQAVRGSVHARAPGRAVKPLDAHPPEAAR